MASLIAHAFIACPQGGLLSYFSQRPKCMRIAAQLSRVCAHALTRVRVCVQEAAIELPNKKGKGPFHPSRLIRARNAATVNRKQNLSPRPEVKQDSGVLLRLSEEQPPMPRAALGDMSSSTGETLGADSLELSEDESAPAAASRV